MEVVNARQVRSALVVPGDIRGEISFQNDLNALLAIVETPGPGNRPTWEALDEMPESPPVDRSGVLDLFLRRLAA